MLIDLKQLLAGKTGRVEIDHEFPLDDPELPFDTAVEGVKYSGTARVRGEILDMGGCVSLSVKVSVDYDTECARCLAPLHRSLTVTLLRTLVEAGSLENTPEEDTDDYLEYTDGMLDIDTPAAEEIVMSLPTRELCREDCKGLCPKCGKDLNEGDCGCVKKEIDPRLAILQKLLEKQ